MGDVVSSGGSASTVTAFAADLGRALQRGDRIGRPYPVNSLVARYRSSPGGSSSGSGRGSGKNPPFARQAARGGAVVAAYEAVRQRNEAAALELGFSLRELDGLTGIELCVALVDIVLGSPEHPEDVALRKAMLQILRKAISETPPPSVQELAIRAVETLAWESASANLASSLRRGVLNVSAVRRISAKVRTYLNGAVRRVGDTLGSATPQAVVNFASRLAARACGLFGG